MDQTKGEGQHSVFMAIWQLLETGAPEFVEHIRNQPQDVFVHELFNEQLPPQGLKEIALLLGDQAKNDASWNGEIPDPKSGRILQVKKAARKGRHPLTLDWCFEIPRTA